MSDGLREEDNVLYGADQIVARFVKELLGERYEPEKSVALGILRDGELIGGVVYFNCRCGDIEFSMAATSPRWIRRRVLSRLFHYPFVQEKCERITAIVSASNEHVTQQIVRLGFREEGRKRRLGAPDIYFGMLRDECRWLEGTDAITTAARRS